MLPSDEEKLSDWLSEVRRWKLWIISGHQTKFYCKIYFVWDWEELGVRNIELIGIIVFHPIA